MTNIIIFILAFYFDKIAIQLNSRLGLHNIVF